MHLRDPSQLQKDYNDIEHPLVDMIAYVTVLAGEHIRQNVVGDLISLHTILLLQNHAIFDECIIPRIHH